MLATKRVQIIWKTSTIFHSRHSTTFTCSYVVVSSNILLGHHQCKLYNIAVSMLRDYNWPVFLLCTIGVGICMYKKRTTAPSTRSCKGSFITIKNDVPPAQRSPTMASHQQKKNHSSPLFVFSGPSLDIVVFMDSVHMPFNTDIWTSLYAVHFSSMH